MGVLGQNKYTSSTGSHTCYDCDYRSQRANNRASCSRCQGGQYKGSWNCIDCPAGKWWQDTGSALHCHNCPAGYINPQRARGSCSVCPKGKFTASNKAPAPTA